MKVRQPNSVCCDNQSSENHQNWSLSTSVFVGVVFLCKVFYSQSVEHLLDTVFQSMPAEKSKCTTLFHTVCVNTHMHSK